ncbi:cystathionine beta-synthase [Pneumocystis carinii B80]|uniref:Cystathionine beta-synthase n=1 Tax=Pneumocystis carinii (strain B80) TaxID=1408658 RepID=A0A0W4ZG81_PNEC8|nr:cystathionine beta-synthase [Pneumocystis carinii B80]KTW27377.1 cystathionine beta-synthase [Pneumocystis carinii B80]
MTFSESILQHIGQTPLIRLNRIPKEEQLECDILVKCEFFNAGGSIKDRIAKMMIEQAEKEGKLVPGSTLIEPTSGNTGIGLALIAAIKGYRMIITLPEKMSQEKIFILKALGAEVIVTPSEAPWDSPESHIGVAKRLNQEIPGSLILNQYENPNNPRTHEFYTATEILMQTDGKVDMVVMGAGTGGTISGVARALKKYNKNIEIVGVDPVGSILALPESLNTGVGLYHIEGIGYDFIPGVLDRSLIDRWIKTSDKESFLMARRLIAKEGLMCGGSSGSAMVAAVLAAKKLGKGKTCVVILPDSVRNYISKFLDDRWMFDHSFIENPKKLTLDTLTLQSMNLKSLKLVNTSSTCLSVLKIMKSNSLEVLPIVDLSKKLVGLASIRNILSSVSRSLSSFHDSITTVMSCFKKQLENSITIQQWFSLKSSSCSVSPKEQFVIITIDTPVLLLMDFLNTYRYAIIVTSTSDTRSFTPTHLLTRTDLLDFIYRNVL